MPALARSEHADPTNAALREVMYTEQYTLHQSSVDAAAIAVEEAKEALREAEDAASAPGASNRTKNLVGFNKGELAAAQDALTLAEVELCAFVAEETERQLKALEDASRKPALGASATKNADIVFNDPPCELCVEKGRVCQRQPNRPASVACLQCVRRSIACSLVPGPKRSRKRQSDVTSHSPRAVKRQHAVEGDHARARSADSRDSDLLRRIDRRSARNARNMTLLMFKICELQNMELPASWEEHSDSDSDVDEEASD